VASHPITVRNQVEINIKTAPHEALKTLGQEGNVLSKAEQVRLARQAVDQLAARAQKTREPASLVAEVRQAREAAKPIDRDVYLNLRAIERHLERQAFLFNLKEICRLAEQGEWHQVSKLAQEPQPRQAQQTSADAAKVLDRVVQTSKQAEALGRLEALLKRPEQARLEGLPAELQLPARGLRSLAELRIAGASRWERPPEVARLKQTIEDLRLASGDPGLAGRVQLDLAGKAFLNGHPTEARALLPDSAPPEHAGNLLRDLKALLVGQGEVQTWPAQRALTAEPGAGGAGPRGPPPGLQPLIPEGKMEGWRPRCANRPGRTCPLWSKRLVWKNAGANPSKPNERRSRTRSTRLM
jgi:hypothetical protein